MGYLLTLLYLSALCGPISAGYFTFISSISFDSYDITSFSMAPSNTKTEENFTINAVVGLSNGNLILLNTKDKNSTFVQLYPFTSSVLNLQWNNNGIFCASKNQVKVYNPYKLKEIISLTFSQSIFKTTTRKRNSTTVMAIAFSSRIQIYENSTIVMTRALENVLQSMAIDCTGKYFYYFDGNFRYVIDIIKRSVFNKNLISNSYSQIVGSCLMDLQDITVALTEAGGIITIWDDYKQLSYYNKTPQGALAFSKQDRYLISYQPRNKKLNLWLTNWTSFNSWSLNESMPLDDLLSIPKIEIKNSMMLLFTNRQLQIYQVTADIPHQGTIFELILFCGIVVFCCCIKVVEVLKKRAAGHNSIDQTALMQQQNQGYQPPYVEGNSQKEGLNYKKEQKDNYVKANVINESINQEASSKNQKQHAKNTNNNNKVNPYGF